MLHLKDFREKQKRLKNKPWITKGLSSIERAIDPQFAGGGGG